MLQLPVFLLAADAEIAVEEVVSEAVGEVKSNLFDTLHNLLNSIGLDPGNINVSNLVSAAVILIVCLIVGNLMVLMLARILAHSKLDVTLHSFIRAGAKAVVYALSFTIAVGSMGVDVTSLVALLSVAGLAASLALQNSLSNVAGGIIILATKPFHVGDFIESGDQKGTVLEIGMAYTKINTIDNKRVFIPNSVISEANIINYSTEGLRRVVLTFNVAYENDMDTVKEALHAIVNRCNTVIIDNEHEVFARLTEYGDSAITYTLRVWCKNEDYWDTYYFLLEEAGWVFAEMGVRITYNRLNVEIVNADGSQHFPARPGNAEGAWL